MQDYTNSKRQSVKTIFAFLVILFVAYLPVSTFMFFIKNDAFSGYFPPKFFMSESLHAGYLPLWNPYINYGIPQYGDMSSGFWSPVTWLIAGTVGYNAYTFTLEVLAYLFIGAMGMYALTLHFNLKKKVRLMAAVAYLCCGYNVGHLQHFNWLSGAAFLPWGVWAYILLHQSFSLKNILLSALIFYLFIASAHPGLIIGAFYFFIALLVFLFFKIDDSGSILKKLKRFILTNSLLLIAVTILGTGLIIGYIDILPHFSRGDPILLKESLKNPTTPQSWISALLPLSTVKNDAFFATDISMRNIYFSLTLLLFFLLSWFRTNQWQKFFLFTGLAFLLFSAGGIFKTFGYKFIPFISYVRLDGEFMIFGILCFIIVAAIQLNRFIEEENEFKGKIKGIYYILEILLIACIVFGLYKTISTKEGSLYSIKSTIAQDGLSEKLKALVDSLTFYDALWLQGIFQLLLLWGIKFCLREKRWKLLTRIVIADVIIATLLNLPFTGVGKASVAEVQTVLNESPHGIPIPSLQAVTANDTVSIPKKGLVGDWSFYNKQIGTKYEAAYPVRLNNTKRYFETIKANPAGDLSSQPYLFAEEVKDSNLQVTSFTANTIGITINANDTGKLIYQQAFYPHWFLSDTLGMKTVQQYSGVFISVPLNKGLNKIKITFEPAMIKTGMLVSLISLLVIVLLLLFNPLFIRRPLIPS